MDTNELQALWQDVSKHANHSFIAFDAFTRKHPFACGLSMLIYPSIYSFIVRIPWMLAKLLLSMIGFGRGGVRKKSLASWFEADNYTYGAGGIRARDSFARLRAAGATIDRYDDEARASGGGFFHTLIKAFFFCYGVYILLMYAEISDVVKIREN
ncbi:hypothetical protein BC629DRAFT_1504997 [Irpex lacteus]|nr:hypothetical protein BC629DRAFT_1504997 [Irpex lacteus]